MQFNPSPSMNPIEGFVVDPNWRERFGVKPFDPSPSVKLRDTEVQCQIVFSLILHLNLSLRDFLFFIFKSDLKSVKQQAGIFLAYNPNNDDSFAPTILYNTWHERFPKCQKYLHRFLIKPCAEEIILSESDAIITDKAYRVAPRLCTINDICNLLHPGKLAAMYKMSAPFTWDLFSIFTTSPNKYQKKLLRKRAKAPHITTNDSDNDSHDEQLEWIEDDECGDFDPRFNGKTGHDWFGKGFARNVTFVGFTICSPVTRDLTLLLDIGIYYQYDGLHAE